jgi:hypothetical protein
MSIVLSVTVFGMSSLLISLGMSAVGRNATTPSQSVGSQNLYTSNQQRISNIEYPMSNVEPEHLTTKAPRHHRAFKWGVTSTKAHLCLGGWAARRFGCSVIL